MAIKKRVKHARSMAEKLIPIPNEFYDTENKEEDLIADRKVLFPFTVFLNLAGLGAFVAFMCYYRYVDAAFVTESTIQGSWDFQGPSGPAYNCTPLAMDPYYKVRWNKDTCEKLFLMPNEDNVIADRVDMSDPNSEVQRYRYYPFRHLGVLKGIVLPHHEPDDTIDASHTTGFWEYYDAIFDPFEGLNSCGKNGLFTPDSPDEFNDHDPANERLFILEAQKNKPLDLYAQWQLPSGNCTITKTEAIAMFQKYVDSHDQCYWTKVNSPYECVRKVPRTIIETFSLAYANSLLVYAVFSSICVKIFFASAKNKNDEDAAAGAAPAEIPA